MILTNTPPFGVEVMPRICSSLAWGKRKTMVCCCVLNKGTNRSLWSSGKAVPPQYLHECNLCLEESKPESNTVAWTPAKWHVSQLVSICLCLSCEPDYSTRDPWSYFGIGELPLRIKLVRVRPILWHVVDGVNWNDHFSSSRDSDTSNSHRLLAVTLSPTLRWNISKLWGWGRG